MYVCVGLFVYVYFYFPLFIDCNFPAYSAAIVINWLTLTFTTYLHPLEWGCSEQHCCGHHGPSKHLRLGCSRLV